MDYNYGGYNNGYVGNDEIFNHRRTPMPFRMDAGKIVEPRINEAYGYNNHGDNNQVEQMYYNNDHDNDGRRDYDYNDRYNRGNYVPGHIFYPMNQEELQETSVRIRLSSTRNVESVISILWRNYGLRCSIDGNVLTVIGDLSSSEVLDGPNQFLDKVRTVSRDSRACIIQRR